MILKPANKIHYHYTPNLFTSFLLEFVKKEHNKEVIAKVRNLPFDKLRVNGLRLKSLTFSVRGELVEPQKNTFAIGSKIRIF